MILVILIPLPFFSYLKRFLPEILVTFVWMDFLLNVYTVDAKNQLAHMVVFQRGYFI